MATKDLLELYRRLHLECLRLALASSDEADEGGRVAAPQPAWAAMMAAMNALPEAEKTWVVLLMVESGEAETMVAVSERLRELVQGRRPS